METSSTKQTRFAAVLPNVTSGLVIGFTMVIIAMSLASLVFSGRLAAALPRGTHHANHIGAIWYFIHDFYARIRARLEPITTS